jgi:hypothetical protein
MSRMIPGERANNERVLKMAISTEVKVLAVNITLKKMTIQKLIELWNETSKQELTSELAMVRGWIMDALEFKNPEAFDKWVDNCQSNDNLEAYFLN